VNGCRRKALVEARGGAEMAGLVVQGVRELNLPPAGHLR
jgi:hypothetical protein